MGRREVVGENKNSAIIDSCNRLLRVLLFIKTQNLPKYI